MEIATQNMERANVLGVGINSLDMERAVETLITARIQDKKGYVCVTGVHGVSLYGGSFTWLSVIRHISTPMTHICDRVICDLNHAKHLHREQTVCVRSGQSPSLSDPFWLMAAG